MFPFFHAFAKFVYIIIILYQKSFFKGQISTIVQKMKIYTEIPLKFFKSDENAALFCVKAAKTSELMDLACRFGEFLFDHFLQLERAFFVFAMRDADLSDGYAVALQITDQRFECAVFASAFM